MTFGSIDQQVEPSCYLFYLFLRTSDAQDAGRFLPRFLSRRRGQSRFGGFIEKDGSIFGERDDLEDALLAGLGQLHSQ